MLTNRRPAPLSDRLSAILPQLAPEAAGALGAVHQLGMAAGLMFTQASTQVAILKVLQDVKETRAYEQLGCTWAQFCELLPGAPSRRTIDEHLQHLDTFGESFVAAAAEIGLDRKTMRLLRAAPVDARPEVLEDGSIQLPDGQVIPVDKDHAEEIREALGDLAESIAQMRTQIDVGSKQIGEVTDQLTKQITRVKELETRDAISDLSPVEDLGSRAYLQLRLLNDHVRRDEPDPALVMRWVRQFTSELNVLIEYGGGLQDVEIDDDFDAGALARSARELNEDEVG